MATKQEQVHVNDAILTNDDSTISYPDRSEKDVPLVLKQAHENDFHIDLGWRSWTVIFLTCFW